MKPNLNYELDREMAEILVRILADVYNGAPQEGIKEKLPKLPPAQMQLALSYLLFITKLDTAFKEALEEIDWSNAYYTQVLAAHSPTVPAYLADMEHLRLTAADSWKQFQALLEKY